MPSSETDNIDYIIQTVRKLKPQSILDIGIGTGKYGLMFRDYLDGHWVGHAFHDPSTWTIRMVGVEIFHDYITPVHQYLYNEIWVGNIINYHPNEMFDLIFMGDVIEHMPKEVGEMLLRKLFRHLNPDGHIIISTPNFETASLKNPKPHHAVFGNQNEMHHSLWEAHDFLCLGCTVNVEVKVQGCLLTAIIRK